MPASISAREPTLGRQNIDAFILLSSPRPSLVVGSWPDRTRHPRRATRDHQYGACPTACRTGRSGLTGWQWREENTVSFDQPPPGDPRGARSCAERPGCSFVYESVPPSCCVSSITLREPRPDGSSSPSWPTPLSATISSISFLTDSSTLTWPGRLSGKAYFSALVTS